MKLLAITSCPSGVAHTYMAARPCRRRLRNMESRSKWRPRGPSEWKSEITAEDVAAADAIILTRICRFWARSVFKDIPIVRVWIGDAIKKADAIIGKIEKLLNEKNETA